MTAAATTSHATRRPGRPTFRRAFSILELLTVIAIIAILFALLFPTIGRARGQAKQAVCASNLRTLYVASQSWKADSDRAGDTSKLLQAYGWMEEWSGHVGNDRRVYNCPEDPSLRFLGGDARTSGDAYRGGDAAGLTGAPSAASPGTSGSGSSGSSSNTTPGTNSSPAGDVSNLVLRDTPDYNNPGKYYDISFTEGPWVKKKNVTPNSYELWAEHHFWDPAYATNGQADWEDVAIRVTTNPDGTVTATLIDRVKGNGHTNFRDDVYVKAPDGSMKKVFNNVYGVDPKDQASPSGTATTLTDTKNGTSSSGSGSSSGGGTGGSGSNGNSTAGTAGTPGSGADASYGFNTNLRLVLGNPQKVMATDYYYSVIDPMKEDWATVTTDKNGRPFFARHNGFVNVLYGDGSVSPVVPTKTNLNPAFGDNRAQFWEK